MYHCRIVVFFLYNSSYINSYYTYSYYANMPCLYTSTDLNRTFISCYAGRLVRKDIFSILRCRFERQLCQRFTIFFSCGVKLFKMLYMTLSNGHECLRFKRSSYNRSQTPSKQNTISTYFAQFLSGLKFLSFMVYSCCFCR